MAHPGHPHDELAAVRADASHQRMPCSSAACCPMRYWYTAARRRVFSGFSWPVRTPPPGGAGRRDHARQRPGVRTARRCSRWCIARRSRNIRASSTRLSARARRTNHADDAKGAAAEPRGQVVLSWRRGVSRRASASTSGVVRSLLRRDVGDAHHRAVARDRGRRLGGRANVASLVSWSTTRARPPSRRATRLEVNARLGTSARRASAAAPTRGGPSASPHHRKKMPPRPSRPRPRAPVPRRRPRDGS